MELKLYANMVILKKQFEFIYDYAYLTNEKGWSIVYICDCRNMQDSHAMLNENIRVASIEDLKKFSEGD